MKWHCALFAVLLLIQSPPLMAENVPDTFSNRLAAAELYLKVAPLNKMMNDSINEMAKNLPTAQRERFTVFMKDGIDIRSLERVALASMARHFTVEELKALAAFYGSRTGQSILKKFGAYIADVLPSIQGQLRSAKQRWEGRLKKQYQ